MSVFWERQRKTLRVTGDHRCDSRRPGTWERDGGPRRRTGSGAGEAALVHATRPADITVWQTCSKAAEQGEREEGTLCREERARHSVFKARPKVQGQKPAVKVTGAVLNCVGRRLGMSRC